MVRPVTVRPMNAAAARGRGLRSGRLVRFDKKPRFGLFLTTYLIVARISGSTRIYRHQRSHDVSSVHGCSRDMAPWHRSLPLKRQVSHDAPRGFGTRTGWRPSGICPPTSGHNRLRRRRRASRAAADNDPASHARRRLMANQARIDVTDGEATSGANHRAARKNRRWDRPGRTVTL